MLRISKAEYDSLNNAGLIDCSKNGKNFRITGQGKPSKRKKFYIVESKKILDFLKNTKN